jgi:transcriptional regulator with XRE-family HTH domain
MSIHERLKRIRIEKSLTLEQLSKIIDVPIRTISSYEQDQRTPSAKYLAKLYNCLQVNINWVVSGTGTMFFTENEYPSYKELIKDEFNLTDKELELIEIQLDVMKKQKS